VHRYKQIREKYSIFGSRAKAIIPASTLPRIPRINNYYRRESRRGERQSACTRVCVADTRWKKGEKKKKRTDIYAHRARHKSRREIKPSHSLSSLRCRVSFFSLSEQSPSSPNCLILAALLKIIRYLGGNVVRGALLNKTNTPSLNIASACPGRQAATFTANRVTRRGYWFLLTPD